MSITFPKHPELAEEVAAFIASRDMAETTFGARAVNDPALIATLRRGRELRRDTVNRIRMFMLTADGAHQ